MSVVGNEVEWGGGKSIDGSVSYHCWPNASGLVRQIGEDASEYDAEKRHHRNS